MVIHFRYCSAKMKQNVLIGAKKLFLHAFQIWRFMMFMARSCYYLAMTRDTLNLCTVVRQVATYQVVLTLDTYNLVGRSCKTMIRGIIGRSCKMMKRGRFRRSCKMMMYRIRRSCKMMIRGRIGRSCKTMIRGRIGRSCKTMIRGRIGRSCKMMMCRHVKCIRMNFSYL